jgi:hypothetical protein
MDPRKVVGATGFEPATPCAQGRCATRLRYAPTLKILNFTTVSRSSPVRVLRFPGENCPRTVPERNSLSQNSRFHQLTCPRTPADSLAAIELPQRLALHLQLHLRVLLEHLRVALASSCVTHSSATPPATPRRVGPTQIVNAEIRHFRSTKRQPPRRFERRLWRNRYRR